MSTSVARFLTRHGLSMATAESCTAGLIASCIADVPGSGGVLRCAIVAYAPEIKMSVLGVPRHLIDTHGLTSEPVSLAMALGVLRLSDASLAIANTGVADGKVGDGTPPGTQCYAWVFRHHGRVAAFTETARFDGTRNSVRVAAARYGIARVPHYFELFVRGEGTPVNVSPRAAPAPSQQ